MQTLVLDVGFSNLIKISVPFFLHVRMDSKTTIFISGTCKWAVGKFAAEIRAIRPPEPYKGKGIAY